jgi:type I restriction enzyme S subunit
MEASRVDSSLLAPRLDAEYYSPEVLPLVKKLRDQGHPTLGRLLATTRRHPMCYGFDQWNTPDLTRVPYFKGEDLDRLSLREGNSYVNAEYFDDYPSAQVRSGEMIMSVRGTIGRVSVCRGSHGLCSPNTIVLVPKSDLDPEFAAAFLSSKQGQVLVNREISGTVQDTITVDAIENIQAIKPLANAQKWIGGKVRQAEQFQYHATTLERDFSDSISIHYPGVFGEPKAFGRSSLVKTSNLRRDLNPGAFNPERIRIRDEIKNAGGARA